MLTAKEAKKQAESIKLDFTEELYEIEKCIDEAILLGCFSVTRAGYIHPNIRRYLEKYGYIVKTGSQYNEPYFSISWE